MAEFLSYFPDLNYKTPLLSNKLVKYNLESKHRTKGTQILALGYK
jgi:hypothetical protein